MLQLIKPFSYKKVSIDWNWVIKRNGFSCTIILEKKNLTGEDSVIFIGAICNRRNISMLYWKYKCNFIIIIFPIYAFTSWTMKHRICTIRCFLDLGLKETEDFFGFKVNIDIIETWSGRQSRNSHDRANQWIKETSTNWCSNVSYW